MGLGSIEEVLDGRRFCAVLGVHRSGSSCVAMQMHHLGVHMGRHLGGYEPSGGGESVELATLCESLMPFPSTLPVCDAVEIRERMANWLISHLDQAPVSQNVVGCKYPHLCSFADALYELIGNRLQIVAVNRDLDASIRSLQGRSQKCRGAWYSASEEECERVQRLLAERRRSFLEAYPEICVLNVDYSHLLEQPADVVDELVDFLELAPSANQLAAAVGHVSPDLRTY